MSAGDVVCTGWLIKSPPEKKLKRFTWRKRWFVLRRGRMSGNPDVLEYYQSQTARKPLRTIDLGECQVLTQTGGLLLKRSLHQKFPFIVKTSARVFYLVAKTEEEKNVWIDRIGQICRCGALKDAAESSDEGFPHTPTPTNHSPTAFPPDPQVTQDPLQEPGQPLDYLFLSQCETGQRSVCISRCESFSTSDSSLELRRSSDPEDNLSSYSFSSPPSNLPLHGHAFRPPLSAPCPLTFDPAGLQPSSCSSSSIAPQDSAPSVFQFPSSLLCTNQHPAPPLPPKPCHQSQISSPWLARDHCRSIPRRISFSGLDHASTTGHADSFSLGNKRLSLNLHLLTPAHHAVLLQPLQHFSPAGAPGGPVEAYMPKSTATMQGSMEASDGYLPMKALGGPSVGLEAPRGHSPLGGPQEDLLPPPVHRHLKPRQRAARPPPLDLRGLSTITEFPTQPPSGQLMMSLGNSLVHFRNGPTYENEEDLDTDDCYTPMESKLLHHSDGAQGLWTRRSNLDYLFLDFNSASPSPVQKKALLVDEHKVDYVKVDEKKTQALQSTRLEWTDVRQSMT